MTNEKLQQFCTAQKDEIKNVVSGNVISLSNKNVTLIDFWCWKKKTCKIYLIQIIIYKYSLTINVCISILLRSLWFYPPIRVYNLLHTVSIFVVWFIMDLFKSVTKITIDDYKADDQADQSTSEQTNWNLFTLTLTLDVKCTPYTFMIQAHIDRSLFTCRWWKMLNMNNRQWLIVVNRTRIMCESVFINWLMFSSLLPIIPLYCHVHFTGMLLVAVYFCMYNNVYIKWILHSMCVWIFSWLLNTIYLLLLLLRSDLKSFFFLQYILKMKIA